MQNRLLLLAFIFVYSFYSSAQLAPAASKSPDYSKEDLLIERVATRVTYESDGSGLRETTARISVQAEAGVKKAAVLAFAYTSANESVELDYVRVRKPDGTVVATPAYNIQDMPADVTRSAPMYSDIHEKHVTVKALGVGDILEYAVRYRTFKPQVPGQFWFEYAFEKNTIARDEELVIDVPRDKYVKVSSPSQKPQTAESGSRLIYTWKHSNLERKETDAQEDEEATRSSVQITTFRSWEDIGRWYGELQRPQMSVTPLLKAKAAELTKGLANDEDKIRALYNFVSTRTHYVSLSFGIGRFQPHAADEVLENEYGDCKDKHTLLAVLLKAAGFEAWPALIHSSRKLDPEVPSPGQFDHVITVVPRGKELIWLDTTPEVAPFALLLANLRDKQALVIPIEKSASLMKSPEGLPFATAMEFNAEGKLSSDGTFTGHVGQSSRGDAEVFLRLTFRQTPQAEWKNLAQGFSYAAGFGGEVSAINASKPDDTTEGFRFSYDYTRKNYSDWENRRITPPLPPFGIEARDDGKTPKKPLILGAPGKVTYRAKIELPTGYTIRVPKNVDLIQDYAEYHASYSFQDGVLTAVRRMDIKKKEVPLAAWDQYRKFRKSVMDDEDYFIELSGGEAGTSDAASKFREGSEAMGRGDVVAARTAFQRVLELDPKFKGAHGNLGLTYLGQSDWENGLHELRKEEEVNPGDPAAYMQAAATLVIRGRREEAMEEWRKLLKADPSNRGATVNLSGMLISAQKYGDAAQVLEAGVKARPDDARLHVSLGEAYLKSGKKEQGLASLLHATAKFPDAEILNKAAYCLAETNFGLAQAKEWAEKAVRQTEGASLKAAGTNEEALGYAMQFASRWDTLGWIYFRLGEFDKAVPYLRAAWNLGQTATGAEHLAEVYEKQGKRTEAARMYQEAFVGASGLSAEQEQIRQRYQRLTGKDEIDGLWIHRRPDGTWTPTLGEKLSNMRKFKVIQAARPSGNATFVVVFSPGKVENVEYVSGDEKLKPMAADIAKTKFNMEFPNQNPSRIVRGGTLNCGSGGCDFVFFSAERSGRALSPYAAEGGSLRKGTGITRERRGIAAE